MADDGNGGVGGQTLAQTGDVDVEAAGGKIVVIAPELLEDEGVGDGLTGTGREQGEELCLPGGQDGAAAIAQAQDGGGRVEGVQSQDNG